MMHTAIKRSNPNVLSGQLAGKLIAIIIAVTLFMAVLLVSVSHAFAAPFPRSQVLVRGENIKLGDVFDGVSQHADFVLAPAPRPGEELVWNAPTLMRIATAFNLPWRPASEDTVSIRRAAVLVDADTVRSLLRDHLATIRADENYNVTLTTEVPEIVVATMNTPHIEIADFNMQPIGGTFNAILKVGGDDGKLQTVNLRGVAEKILNLPVLNKTVRNGDIITEGDITWVSQSAASVRKDVATDAAMIVGTTPRKIVASGNFIRMDDLQQPQMIARGEVITMIYKQAGIYLTAKGRALEDGAMGQVIKVSNMGSNRQLEAKVSAKKEVTVQ